jgi:hypothetical protein
MAEMSNYLEQALINATLRGNNFTAPTTIYVALFTSNPTDANTGTEVVGASYARTAVTFAAPSDGLTVSAGDCTFPQATTTWGTIGWIGLMDASTGGNLLYHTPLDVSKLIENGDIFKINAGNLSVQLS